MSRRVGDGREDDGVENVRACHVSRFLRVRSRWYTAFSSRPKYQVAVFWNSLRHFGTHIDVLLSQWHTISLSRLKHCAAASEMPGTY